jgi:uncharacterized protein YjbI with pentapeptide repeats
VDLESADLSGSDARGADFTGANLGRARLLAADFAGARLEGVNLASARLERTSLAKADLRRAHLGQRIVKPSQDDDSGVGALLLDTDLSGADLRGSHLGGVVMLRGSLAKARLDGATTRGSRWLDVGFQGVRCPDGSRVARGSSACAGFVVPRTAAERQPAEAWVAGLRARPWPED